MRKNIYKILLVTFVAITSFASCDRDDEMEFPDDANGIVINGVRWATRNVGNFGAFTDSPATHGGHFQWNNGQGGNNVTEWESANDPCPVGWRVPTQEELQSLVDAGCIWIAQRNGLAGRLFGTAPNQIFLPAAGWRNIGGPLRDVGAYGVCWSSTQGGTGFAWSLQVSSSHSNVGWDNRASGLSVRCVAE